MTATYWEIGRRIVEFEQGAEKRAEYGAKLLETLAADLTRRFGRGFSGQPLQYTRQLYVNQEGRGYFGWPAAARAENGRADLKLHARLISQDLIPELQSWHPARRANRKARG